MNYRIKRFLNSKKELIFTYLMFLFLVIPSCKFSSTWYHFLIWRTSLTFLYWRFLSAFMYLKRSSLHPHFDIHFCWVDYVFISTLWRGFSTISLAVSFQMRSYLSFLLLFLCFFDIFNILSPLVLSNFTKVYFHFFIIFCCS